MTGPTLRFWTWTPGDCILAALLAGVCLVAVHATCQIASGLTAIAIIATWLALVAAGVWITRGKP